jgi:hypothetical protein
MARFARQARWLIAIAALATCGCASGPYRYGRFQRAHPERFNSEGIVIEHGQPHKVLDGMARVVGFPARLVRLHSKVNSHEMSPETTGKLKTYLEKNDLTDVHVYVNHYDPRGQWRRLRENKLIGPGWRYTAGAASLVGYTLLPGRVFGGDRYNPYTNSLYVNSDVPALILYEAAYAKDVHARRMPGFYATVNQVPGLTLWRQSRALGDVVGYAQAQGDWDVEREAYHVLYPHVGAEATSSVASPFITTWWGGPAAGLGGAAMGHAAGRTVAARRAKSREQEPLPTGITPSSGLVAPKPLPSP